MSNIEGQKRKSARISAFQIADKDKRKRRTGQHQVGEASQRNTTPPPPPLRQPVLAGSGSAGRPPLPGAKKGRKKKRLDEVAGSFTAPTTRQDVENPKHEDSHASCAILPSAQQMPGKDLLEFFLDILQRRDTHEIFAQPVDGEEVEGYYDIIKEPMDFGTMRAKLQEGMYTTLEQFEKDVFLISSNAMLFNSSTTIFFRQARAIHELAKKVFHTLKTDPRRIEDEFSQTRKIADRKPQGEAGPSRTRPANLRGNARACHGSSSLDPLVDRRDNAVLPGSGDGRNVKFCRTERHQTYKPRASLATENEPIVSTVYNCPKQLVPGNGGLGYKQSLLRFVKHLSPTAQMVAQRKMGSLAEAPIYQSQKSSNSVEYTDHLISFPTAQQGPAIENQMPHMFRNRPAHSIIISDANNRLGIHAATLKGKAVQPSGLMDIHGAAASEQTDMHHAASKGKNVFTGEGMDILGHSSGGMKSYAIDRNEDIAARIPEPCEKYMTADTMVGSSQLGDQIQPVQLASGSHSGLLKFMSRANPRPRSFVHPSKVIIPSSSSQTNTLSHALDSHSLGGVERTNAQLIHNYRASSAQVSQAMEWSLPTPWGPQVVSDFPHVQSQQLLSVPYMQADVVNAMGHKSQLPSAPFMGQLSTGLNPLGNNAFLQQQLALTGNMQPQPNAVNMLGQDAFPQGAQLGMVPGMHPQPSNANALDQDVYARQDMQLALARHMQLEPTGMNLLCQSTLLQQGGQFAVPPEGLVFNAGNIHEKVPPQGDQVTPPHHPNLNLQL